MRRPPIESFDELRVALAAVVPPQHRARVVAIGRMLLAAFEAPAPPTDPSAPPGESPAVGAPAAAAAPEAAPAAEAAEIPTAVRIQPRPGFDRIVDALRVELDRHGIELPEVRRRAGIPLVPLRPRRVPGDHE